MTGLMYYRARWYDSYQGRFLSEDPLDFKDGIAQYAYVDNDPVSYSDPLGLNKKGRSGNPLHPSGGLPPTKCLASDSCPELESKTVNIAKLLHRRWLQNERSQKARRHKYNKTLEINKKYGKNLPLPNISPGMDSGHEKQIDQLLMQLNECIALMEQKCKNNNCPPVTPPVPVIIPGRAPSPGPNRVPLWMRLPLRVLVLPIFFLPPCPFRPGCPQQYETDG